MKRREEGIYVEDQTWEGIVALMAEVGVTETVGSP